MILCYNRALHMFCTRCESVSRAVKVSLNLLEPLKRSVVSYRTHECYLMPSHFIVKTAFIPSAADL